MHDKEFSISYLDNNEAIFLLGLLKAVPCTHCPDFYQGCAGGNSVHDVVTVTDREYIDNHVAGTEGFLCGKLRNITCLSKAEEQEISNSFEEKFNKRVSVLAKRHDSCGNKYVLIDDSEEFQELIKALEHRIVSHFQNQMEKINQHNISVINEMKETIRTQEKQIEQMQVTIKKLKRSSCDV